MKMVVREVDVNIWYEVPGGSEFSGSAIAPCVSYAV
jgi:hypothetical protein